MARVFYHNVVKTKKQVEEIGNGQEMKLEHELLLVEETGGTYTLSKRLFNHTIGEVIEQLPLIQTYIPNEPIRIFFDQSTSTGYSIFIGRQLYAIGRLSAVGKVPMRDYKYTLKALIDMYVGTYTIDEVWYEEVYDAKNRYTTELLMYIKHVFEDLKYEYESVGRNVYMFSVDHTVWKKYLAVGVPVKQKSDIEELVKENLDLDDEITKYCQEDMYDSLGMGIARTIKLGDDSLFLMARYNKKLPVHKMAMLDITDIETMNLRKPYRLARETGGVMVYTQEETFGEKPDVFARRILSHGDCLIVVEVNQAYREYAIEVLTNNLKTADIKDDTIYLLFAKK